MRVLMVPAVLLGVLALARPASAQGYPAEMTIMLPEVEVRSGPTKEYYPTSKLRYGDRVLVLRESKDQPGWLAIKPPQGSFSWINAKFVKQVDARTGYVESEGNTPVPVRPGSSLINKAPDVEVVKIPSGSIVTILDKGVTADGSSWVRIQPPPTEVRYIPGEAVQARQLASNNNNVNINGPTAAGYTSNPYIAKAEQALQTGQVDLAKQLFKDAFDRTTDTAQKNYAYNRLTSLTQNAWMPGQPQATVPGMTAVRPVGQNTPFQGTTNAPAQTLSYPPQWSQWGILRKAAFEKDGQPVYVLENRQGQALLYAVSEPGKSLKDYVGRPVALYGPLTYRSDDYLRTHFMTASHVAVP